MHNHQPIHCALLQICVFKQHDEDGARSDERSLATGLKQTLEHVLPSKHTVEAVDKEHYVIFKVQLKVSNAL